jgi:hypothetical protein
VDRRWLRDAPLGENETAVAVVNDFPRLVDDILQVLPETQQVFMVIGTGALGQFWRRELESQSARFRGRVELVWSDELSLSEILRRCASLPPHSAIFYLTFGTDAQGGSYPDDQVLADLHATANAPLFGALSPMLGHESSVGQWYPLTILAKAQRTWQAGFRMALHLETSESRLDFRITRYSIGASCGGGASPRSGCRLAAW